MSDPSSTHVNAPPGGQRIGRRSDTLRELALDRHPVHPVDGALCEALLEFTLRQADSALVLAQRLCEWIGKAPALEEDIAQTNVGLDLVGQARLWYAYAGEIEARMGRIARDEDALAFHRDAAEYRNLLLVEQPNGDYAQTIVRQCLFDSAQQLLLAGSVRSNDARVAEIAAKAVKENAYHVERSSEWVIRLGDGTDESHGRMQQALDLLWPYTGQMFDVDASDEALIAANVVPDPRPLRGRWRAAMARVLDDATLVMPADGPMQRGGRHSEHLGHLLCEMQFLQRAYPDARW